MSRLDRETGKLVRDILALPERERIKAFETLREDLADAAPPSKVDEKNEQMAYAIEIFDEVADHLGLDDDMLKLGMKMREFDSAPNRLRRNVKARQIAGLFGSWEVAKQAAAGEPGAPSPAQRKRRQLLSAKRRKSAHFQEGVTAWLATDPDPASRAAYDRWRKKRNKKLSDGELPYLGSTQITNTLKRTWTEVLGEVRAGNLRPFAAEDEDLWASRRSDPDAVPAIEVETASPDEFDFDPELVARRLQQARKSRGWTIPDLATEAELSAENVGGVEDQGRPKVTFGTIVRLARALEVSLDYFATDDGASGLPPRERRSYPGTSARAKRRRRQERRERRG